MKSFDIEITKEQTATISLKSENSIEALKSIKLDDVLFSRTYITTKITSNDIGDNGAIRSEGKNRQRIDFNRYQLASENIASSHEFRMLHIIIMNECGISSEAMKCIDGLSLNEYSVIIAALLGCHVDYVVWWEKGYASPDDKIPASESDMAKAGFVDGKKCRFQLLNGPVRK